MVKIEPAIQTEMPDENIDTSNDVESADVEAKSKYADCLAPGRDRHFEWKSNADMFFTTLNYSTNIYVIWNLPVQCYENGGVFFFIPYFLVTILTCTLLYHVELTLGQCCQTGSINMWGFCPLLKGMAMTSSLLAFVIASHHTMITAWSFHYFVFSFFSPPPWSQCSFSPYWARHGCSLSPSLVLQGQQYGFGFQEVVPNVTNGSHWRLPADLYFHTHVLEIQPFEHSAMLQLELVLAMAMTLTLVLVLLSAGPSIFGRMSYCFTFAPMIIFFVIFVVAVSEKGAVGIYIVMFPNYSGLLRIETWGNAAFLAILSSFPSWNTLASIASLNNYKSKSLTIDHIFLPIASAIQPMLIAMPICALVGVLHNRLGFATEQFLIAKDSNLIFVLCAQGLSYMKVPSLWSALFYLSIAMVSFSTLVPIVQSVALSMSLREAFPRRTHQLAYLMCTVCVCFLIGIALCSQAGFLVMQLIQSHFFIMIPMLAAIELTAVITLYGCSNLAEDVRTMTGAQPMQSHVTLARSVVALIILLLVVIYKLATFEWNNYGVYIFPDWTGIVFWMIFASFFIIILMYGTFEVAQNSVAGNAIIQAFVQSVKPNESWSARIQQKNNTGANGDGLSMIVRNGSTLLLTNGKMDPQLSDGARPQRFRISATEAIRRGYINRGTQMTCEVETQCDNFEPEPEPVPEPEVDKEHDEDTGVATMEKHEAEVEGIVGPVENSGMYHESVNKKDRKKTKKKTSKSTEPVHDKDLPPLKVTKKGGAPYSEADAKDLAKTAAESEPNSHENPAGFEYQNPAYEASGELSDRRSV